MTFCVNANFLFYECYKFYKYYNQNVRNISCMRNHQLRNYNNGKNYEFGMLSRRKVRYETSVPTSSINIKLTVVLLLDNLILFEYK